MEKKIRLYEDYLYLPVWAGKDTKCLEIFHDTSGVCEKLFEFQIPVPAAAEACGKPDYFARFPVKNFTDKTLILKGELPECFFAMVESGPLCKRADKLRHPSIHFTAETGWINDPNGLVYKDGIYHLYFQYNPLDTKWNNMCWGHAVSSDLLHWEQKDTVLFPDENGAMFSGSAIINEHKKLNLSKDALLFFYSAAGGANRWSEGKLFSQRIAYSLDGGETLIKIDKDVLPALYRDNRDPKVFWHEESQSYIMVLWLLEHDFGIFRSKDLELWEQSDRLTLEQAFECPDLVRLYDEEGTEHWMFWCADGYYFWGEFDGFHFLTDGVRREAYMNKIPYAAQTYAGVKGRVIQIPWLRLPNCGELYTGAMGIPRELSVLVRNGERVLRQRPVREFITWKEKKRTIHLGGTDGKVMAECVFCDDKDVPVAMEWKGEVCVFQIGKKSVSYHFETGEFSVGEECCRLRPGICDFLFVLDDSIFEVTADCDTIIGAFEWRESGRR